MDIPFGSFRRRIYNNFLFLAFDGSPNNCSTSVGRKYCGSICTNILSGFAASYPFSSTPAPPSEGPSFHLISMSTGICLVIVADKKTPTEGYVKFQEDVIKNNAATKQNIFVKFLTVEDQDEILQGGLDIMKGE